MSFSVSQSLLKFMSIELAMLSNHLILCCPLSCLQSFPASGSFPMSRLFASGGQSIGASASALVLPMNIQSSFPLGLTSLISLQTKGLSRVYFNHCSKASILRCSAFFMVQLSHPHMTTGKAIAFLPRSKHLLTSQLQSPSAVILEPKKIKSATVSIFFPIYLP